MADTTVPATSLAQPDKVEGLIGQAQTALAAARTANGVRAATLANVGTGYATLALVEQLRSGTMAVMKVP